MRSRPRLAAALAAGTALVLLGSGCSSAADGPELTVLAAASLTETFEELAEEFERDHPGVDVTLVLESSSTLAEQVRQGAPGDVLATADLRTMTSVVSAGATSGEPETFATNRLVLAVPLDGDPAVDALDDLDSPGVRFVVCVPSAPCGRTAKLALDESGVRARPASEEIDVKAVLHKVVLGEADAGFVYATDVLAADTEVRAVGVSPSPGTVTRYAVATLRDAEEPVLADDWVDLVLSERGQRVLSQAGFGPP